MPLATGLTRALGIDAPVLSAPMAMVAGGKLAAAVGRAGGLGFIGGGYGDRRWLERELAAAGGIAVGIGFISWSLAREPALLDLALDHAPRAVFLSFGDLAPFAATVQRAGTPLIAQVQSVAAARQAAAEGADIIVAQGTEAGGHGAARATLALVPAVVDAVSPVPVLAAGGIADGRGVAAALMLGAAGVVCGTAFYVAEESLAHENAKAAAAAASGDGTVRSPVFDRARGLDWPRPYDLRTLRNAFHARWADEPQALDAAAMTEHRRAVAEGDVDTAAVIVGEAVDLVQAIEPAGTILARLVAEAERRLEAAPGLVADLS